MKKFIPNFITLLNLLSGVISIYLAFSGNIIIASALVIAASVFDFFDGFTARLLKAYSEVGKQLDSLADLVSFGVAPSFILHRLIHYNLTGVEGQYGDVLSFILVYSPLLIPLFSAYRLAVFNVDEKQTTSFLGLPTPATGIFLASLAFVFEAKGFFISAHWVVICSMVLAFMMVSNVPMLSLKFKNLNFNENKFRFILIGCAIILAIWLQVLSIPLIIIVYILLSLLKVVL
jgi:CDP-diacylglycerol--serine O-phosphatidyltransferase